MRFLLILLFCLAPLAPLSAQVNGIDQNSELIQVGGDKFLRWYGHEGRTYFLQISDPNDHLNKWTWAPIIESGNDEDISYEVDGTADKGFFRLKYSDQPTTDPDGDDFDYDGLSNWDEVSVHGTDPMEWDTDGDGLSDFWEIENGLDPNDDGSIDPANGANGDPDGDGLTNEFEYWYGGDPYLTDTDSDGLNDYDEVFVHSTSPANSDSDGDSLSDFSEIYTHGTNPNLWDTDEDTLSDGDEILVHFTNPLEMDTDGDWMWDDYEIANNLNPNNAADGLLDADGDTLTNQLEFVFLDKGFDPFVVNNAAVFPWAGDPDWDGIITQVEFVTHLTNPRQSDTDGDGMNDAWELAHGFNPKLNNQLAGPANQNPNADPDGDGLTNAEEEQLGTNPNNIDTDGDGVNDGVEDGQGSNPNDPNDSQPPPNGTVPATFTFGDHSGSHSEKYRVQLTPLEGDTGGVRFRTNRQYGQTQEGTFRLPKGAKYKVELIHIGTNPRYRGTPRPDYDYTLEVDDTANCLVVDDPDGIMGVNWDSDPFYAEGKDATLYVPLFEWVTPKASPVTAADDAGDGQNEFTYDAASPGVLTIDLKVLVKPTGTAAVTDRHGVKFSDRCVYKLPTITGSTFAWDAANTDGKSATSGERLIAKATYTTLPAAYTDFGLKQAEFECDGHTDTLAKGDFEVFFPKDEKNHPGVGAGTTPNWFFYWRQVYGQNLQLEYGGAGNGTTAAEVPAVTQWSYAAAQNKQRIIVYDLITEQFRAYGVGEEFSGIDQYVGSVIHEAKHVDQVARADQLGPTGQAGSPWQFGWSFNQGAGHNHWTLGTDGQPGIAGVDDDGDGTTDNLITGGPGELGKGDDVDLTHATTTSRNWAAAWPPPVPLIYFLELEAEAINASDAANNENDNARSDWGNPGKNHQTIDKYDD
jgi:hypothetical protein